MLRSFWNSNRKNTEVADNASHDINELKNEIIDELVGRLQNARVAHRPSKRAFKLDFGVGSRYQTSRQLYDSEKTRNSKQLVLSNVFPG
jgi:hypothetical protein